jgi:hypothetical protein
MITKLEICEALGVPEATLDSILAAGVRGVSMKVTMAAIAVAIARSNEILDAESAALQPQVADVESQINALQFQINALKASIPPIFASVDAKRATHNASIQILRDAYNRLESFALVDAPDTQAVINSIV